MKRIKYYIVLLGLIGFAAVYSLNTECNVTVQFNTMPDNMAYMPKQVMDVWIKDQPGKPERTLNMIANAKKQNSYTLNEETKENTMTGKTIKYLYKQHLFVGYNTINLDTHSIPFDIYQLHMEHRNEIKVIKMIKK